ncbi:MAG: TauD/TfdA family dioxygenase [Ottowia sp.]|uniref:TauD/TfdA family dioxygenase n=1 Tax=Ottowia sp. TaxID=1898956 RepID=UPI003C72A24F
MNTTTIETPDTLDPTVVRGPIRTPSAWTAHSFKSSADFTMHLPAEAASELRRIVTESDIATLEHQQITLAKFGTPVVKDLMDGLHRELWEGRGLLLLKGLPIEGLSIEQIQAYYWLLGLYLGKPVSQSAAGERIGFVQDRTKPGQLQTERGYTSRRELPLHTDGGDFMGLLCIRAAPSGGLSVGTSVHAVYNTMLERCPELLPRLFRGFPYHRKGEQPDDQPMVTPYNVPVLAWIEDRLSARYIRPSMETAYKALGREWDPLDTKALDAFDDISWDDDHLIRFMMEPGDLYLASNWTTLHSRTEFVDHEEQEKKRLVLRIWLQREPRTPVPRHMCNYQNPSGDLGIDGKPGGKPAGAEYLTHFKQRAIEVPKEVRK